MAGGPSRAASRGGEVHWWQACRLITREDCAACRVIEMGGAIPRDVYSWEKADEAIAFANRVLHKHNWLNGHIYARLHANGVCEIYAHYVNSKFFDDGLPLEDAVPVIGVRTDAGSDAFAGLTGPWDGSRKGMQLGGVRFDLTDAAHLASARQPGSLAAEGDLLVWQPYLGMELYGGHATMQRLGDPFVVRAEDRIILRGMARTLRFSFSLSPDRPPAVVRYQAPAWWYGACEEFMPEPLLPVSNDYDRTLTACREWIAASMVRSGFEDGSVPRGGAKPGTRGEPGWEGEVPYAQFLSAWRTGDAAEHDDALRSAYHFTDLAVDHAVKMVRMHGFPPDAFALPMARVQGTIAAYLETGDPYLLDTARAVVETTYWTHKNSWPRLGVGRDSCFARSAMLLYRYLGEPRYLAIARDAIADVLASQRDNGSFGDQGGGSGIHQMPGYISKPWMGLMALGGALDYLEMFPDDEEALAGVKRFADWLMAERFDHDGVMGWSYQHEYAGGRIYPAAGKVTELPGGGLWHLEYLARFLMFCALRFDRRDYFEAWEESYQATFGKGAGDHRCAQVLQYIPWLQAKLFRARITDEGVCAEPVWLGDRTPREAAVFTPEGPVSAVWTETGECVARVARPFGPPPRPSGLGADMRICHRTVPSRGGDVRPRGKS